MTEGFEDAYEGGAGDLPDDLAGDLGPDGADAGGLPGGSATDGVPAMDDLPTVHAGDGAQDGTEEPPAATEVRLADDLADDPAEHPAEDPADDPAEHPAEDSGPEEADPEDAGPGYDAGAAALDPAPLWGATVMEGVAGTDPDVVLDVEVLGGDGLPAPEPWDGVRPDTADGLPWTDARLLGADGDPPGAGESLGGGSSTSGEPPSGDEPTSPAADLLADLAADSREPPPAGGVIDWATLRGSDDPVLAALALRWGPAAA